MSTTTLSTLSYRVTDSGVVSRDWRYIYGSLGAVNDTVTLRTSSYGIGMVDLGLGTSDSLVFGMGGGYVINIKNVEYASVARNSSGALYDVELTQTGFTGFTVDGSFKTLRMGPGDQTVTYTAAMRDSELFMGGGNDTVVFIGHWSLVKAGNGKLDAYDLNTGYRVRMLDPNDVLYGEIEKIIVKETPDSPSGLLLEPSKNPDPNNQKPTDLNNPDITGGGIYLLVSDAKINEVSPYAVLSVDVTLPASPPNRTLFLSLQGGTSAGQADITNANLIEIYDGANWVAYDAVHGYTLGSASLSNRTRLMLRVNIAGEQEAVTAMPVFEGLETFKVQAVMKDNSAVVQAQATGYVTIADDGTGDVLSGALAVGTLAPVALTVAPDDDRNYSPDPNDPENKGDNISNSPIIDLSVQSAYYNAIRYSTLKVKVGQATVYRETAQGIDYSAPHDQTQAGNQVLALGEQGVAINGYLRLFANNVYSNSFNKFNNVFLGSIINNSVNMAPAKTAVFLYGFGGDDVLTGGSGNDYVFGGVGNNTVVGNEGLDYFGAGNINPQSVKYATSGQITLSGLQGYAAGDRVLVKSQTLSSENGIYVVSGGAWQRAADFNETLEMVSGTPVYVESDRKAYSLMTSEVVDVSKLGVVDLASVRLATTSNMLLRGLQMIDGVQTASGDRVLVKSQTIASENGIYVVSQLGWTRASDFDAANTEVADNRHVLVTEGRSNANTYWVSEIVGPVTLGTTAIGFQALNDFDFVRNTAVEGATNSGVTTVKAASSANIVTLAGSQTIDGVVLAQGDLVLVKNQQVASQNGIYVVNASGAWARNSDYNEYNEFITGQTIHVNQGLVNAKSSWMLTSDAVPLVGVSPIEYQQIANSGTVTLRSVHVATSQNITLSGLQIVDGLSVSLGDRVLVKSQTDASENGIYVASSGFWTRASDLTASDITQQGNNVFVEDGNYNRQSSWTVYSPSVGGAVSVTSSMDRIQDWQGAGTDTLRVLPNGEAAIEGVGSGSGLSYTASILATNGLNDLVDLRTNVTNEGKITVLAGPGNDTVHGSAGFDFIRGQDGNDLINGNDGRDVIYGDAGNDTIDGGNGDDVLLGGEGNDNLVSGTGNNFIYGGNGFNNINLTGGANDRVYIDDWRGRYNVTGFQQANDKIYIDNRILPTITPGFYVRKSADVGIESASIGDGEQYNPTPLLIGDALSNVAYHGVLDAYRTFGNGNDPVGWQSNGAWTNAAHLAAEISARGVLAASANVSFGLANAFMGIPIVGPIIAAPFYVVAGLFVYDTVVSNGHRNATYGGAELNASLNIMQTPKTLNTSAGTWESSINFTDFYNANFNDGFAPALEVGGAKRVNAAMALNGGTLSYPQGIFGFATVETDDETFLYLINSKDNIITNNEARLVAQIDAKGLNASNFVFYDGAADPYNNTPVISPLYPEMPVISVKNASSAVVTSYGTTDSTTLTVTVTFTAALPVDSTVQLFANGSTTALALEPSSDRKTFTYTGAGLGAAGADTKYTYQAVVTNSQELSQLTDGYVVTVDLKPPTISGVSFTDTGVRVTSDEEGTAGVYLGTTLVSDGDAAAAGVTMDALVANLSEELTLIPLSGGTSYSEATIKVLDKFSHTSIYSGNYQIWVAGGNVGSTANNTGLFNTSKAQVVYGDSGNNTIYGNNSSDSSLMPDFLSGGAGNDTIYGQAGSDQVYGGSGSDSIYGGTGANLIAGGADADTIYLTTGSANPDTLSFNVTVPTSGAIVSDSGVGLTLGGRTGQDTLVNYDVTNDSIILNAAGISNFSHLTNVKVGTYSAGIPSTYAVTDFNTNVGLIDFNNDGNYSDFAVNFVDSLNAPVAITLSDFKSHIKYSITGTDNADAITTGDMDDNVISGAGNDVIAAGAGNDLIWAGAGADVINVGTGYDKVQIDAGDVSGTTASAGAAALAQSGDVILGLTNGDGGNSSDKLDLDQAGFGSNFLMDLKVVTVNLAATGALDNSNGSFLLHNSVIAGDAVTGTSINASFVTSAINLIKTANAATNSDTTSDAYVGIFDSAVTGTNDLAIFKINHTADTSGVGNAGKTILDTEINLVGVLKDFGGTTLTNGFVV